MADGAPLVLHSQDGAIARLTLNRPAAGNSLSMGLVAALHAELDRLASRPEIKVIVLSGMGGRIFSAGHDLNEFAGNPDEEFLARDFAGIAAVMQAIVAQPQIVIAKVEGVATAAGLELVAACDLALASTEARFAVPGVNIGFWCHTPQVLLSRTVGRKQALEMLVTGKLHPADHALRIGLVNALHPPDALDAAVDALCATIVSKAGSVLRRGKQSFNRQATMPLAQAYDYVRGEALENVLDPDAREGIAAFLEKRPPHWQE
ncbi:MAG: enoyl-CoA hydratase [Sphingomonadales bacterium]|nr:enoyl-CoA hydratase [Sphingomonadales bacterium]